MRFIPTLSTFFLAAVFVYAAVDKAFHYQGFVNAVASYAMVPAQVAGILAPLVIAVELWVGLGLLVPRWRLRHARAGAFVLLLFTVAMAINQFAAPGSDCGCWFSLTLARGTGAHFALNLLLIALAITVWLDARQLAPGSSSTHSRRHSTVEGTAS